MSRHIAGLLIFSILFAAFFGIIDIYIDFYEAGRLEEVKQAEPNPEIKFSSTELLPGGCFGIYIAGLTDRDEIMINTALGQGKPSFHSYLEGKLAVVGISCRTENGEYKYRVQVYRDGEVAAEGEEIIKVLPKEFEKQYLTVSAEQKSQRSDENFDEDKIHTNRAKSTTMDRPLWKGVFVKPVEGRISTEFGLIRYINKEESGRHSGLDIAAAKGTPVKAANNGIVRLSMMLKVTGNTIIIDHGSNVYSSYAHLDKLLAEEGTEVKKGDIIGEVGSTGFSTGPHLHWTASVGSLYINPEALMEKDLLDFINSN